MCAGGSASAVGAEVFLVLVTLICYVTYAHNACRDVGVLEEVGRAGSSHLGVPVTKVLQLASVGLEVNLVGIFARTGHETEALLHAALGERCQLGVTFVSVVDKASHLHVEACRVELEVVARLSQRCKETLARCE